MAHTALTLNITLNTILQVVSSLLNSIPSMAGVALLCCFLFTVFGIFGTQIWAGSLANQVRWGREKRTGGGGEKRGHGG